MPLLLFLLLVLIASPAPAIVVRHDRDEARFRELAATVPDVVDMNLPGGTGTLIGSRWVLTASHVAALLKERHQVVIGGEKFEVARVIPYPGASQARHDIALVELTAEVTSAQPVAIYRGQDEQGLRVVFAGRGMHGDGREGPAHRDHALRAATNVVDRAVESFLVFDFDAPADATELEGISGPGDSGGPAYLVKDGAVFVAGVSSGQDSRKTGREGVYGVTEYYARVSSYAGWIDSVVQPFSETWLRKQAQKLEQALDRSRVDDLQREILAATPTRRTWPPVRRGANLFLVQSAITGGAQTRDAEIFIQKRNGKRELLLDTQSLFPQGDYELQRYFSVSPDRRTLAYSFAQPASRWLEWRFLDLASRRTLPETLKGAHTTVTTVAWSPDSKRFVYGRFATTDDGKVRDQRLYLHRLGSPQSEDRLVMGEGAESDRWFMPYAESDALLIVSGRGTGNETRVLSMPFDGSDEPVVLQAGSSGTFNYLGSLAGDRYFLTNSDAPRWKIVRHRQGKWSTVVHQHEHAIAHAALVGGRLIIARIAHAQPVFAVATLDGREKPLILPPGNVWGGSWGPGFVGEPEDDRAYFIVSSLTTSGAVHWLEPRTMKLGELEGDSSRAAALVMRHVRYRSSDGTEVPMAIAHRPGLELDGSHPVIIYGYGAFSWSAYPWFQPQMVAWLERGGIFALPGIRGGGEYGEEWHRAGSGVNRENAVNDYLAAVEWLIANKYTSPKRVVASTSSIGSAVVATAVLRRPQSFGAALIDIPVLDLLRYDQHTGGAMWAAELGDPKKPEHARVLRAMTPMLNLPENHCSPATLVTAGSRDETAVPVHAYQYVQALQGAQSCDAPVLLQVVDGAGHSHGATPEQAARTWAVQLAFIEKWMK